ncbi:MAG: hypothetical protein KIS92_14530 [Planctomycetota bacterium]|nr:hypothetical protein [Planctomycetota bacterium]
MALHRSVLFAAAFAAAFAAGLSVRAQEQPPGDEVRIAAAPQAAHAGEPGALTIARSPKGQEQADLRAAMLANELFRKSVEGDAEATRRWDGLTIIERAGALARASENAHRPLRKRALEELARMSEDGMTEEARTLQRRALARAAVHEPIDEIREAARNGWLQTARRDGPKAAEEMGEALDLDHPAEKRRAFENLRELGGNGVLEVLITKVTLKWGKFPRSHMVIGSQRSYISDYDVSGSAYDPVVKSFLTGVVFDVQITEVEVTKYIVEGLRRLGADDDTLKHPNAWKEFVKKQGK